MRGLLATLCISFSILMPIAYTPPAHAQPTTIEFFGQNVTADGFYFAFDYSTSMYGVASLQRVKAEIAEALQQLAPTDEFGIVGFSSTNRVFHVQPQTATTAHVQSALHFLRTVDNLGASCGGNGVVELLQIANQGATSDRRVLVISDGEWNCPGAATEVPQITNANANGQWLPINGYHVGGQTHGVQTLQNLAHVNGGVYVGVGPLQADFIRGDASSDGVVNVTDAVAILYHLFLGIPVTCKATADMNTNGLIELIDAISLVRYLFSASVAVPAPFPSCGTGSGLEDCYDFSACP